MFVIVFRSVLTFSHSIVTISLLLKYVISITIVYVEHRNYTLRISKFDIEMDLNIKNLMYFKDFLLSLKTVESLLT